MGSLEAYAPGMRDADELKCSAKIELLLPIESIKQWANSTVQGPLEHFKDDWEEKDGPMILGSISSFRIYE